MESTASTRLFNIPELVSIVASYLDKKDITTLMQTNRHMQQLITSVFYRDLSTHYGDLRAGGVNLWESPEGLRALARNIRHARTWRSGLFFFVYYLRATAGFYDSNIDNTSDSAISKFFSQNVPWQSEADVSFIPQPSETWDDQPTDTLHT
ncbi:hypothetical protein BG015_009211 [Linnemannia schmuckeri]|uniref:F-box domain-containing protein n=1 Tax=Linnemannia schmuckeri TaxID=64567 RepID=A0A9P5RYJ5_9FUNG|nr:hypothetical protein BG015_009211 [Linnemannia schmuckeri]